MKNLVFALIAITLFSCTKQAKPLGEFATKKNGSKQVEVLATQTTVTIANNGGSFSVDYGGATDVVWMFFRWGDSLSVSGNVIPSSSQSYYLNPVTTVTANGSGLFYQAVVITGTVESKGLDWVTSYSNVVQ